MITTMLILIFIMISFRWRILTEKAIANISNTPVPNRPIKNLPHSCSFCFLVVAEELNTNFRFVMKANNTERNHAIIFDMTTDLRINLVHTVYTMMLIIVVNPPKKR